MLARGVHESYEWDNTYGSSQGNSFQSACKGSTREKEEPHKGTRGERSKRASLGCGLTLLSRQVCLRPDVDAMVVAMVLGSHERMDLVCLLDIECSISSYATSAKRMPRRSSR
jgi:hypothetical protein